MDPDSVPTVDRVQHGGTAASDQLEFSANVNPETPAGLDAVLGDALADARRYPDEPAQDFRRAAAAYAGVSPERIVPTPGGLAAIRLIVETTVGPGDRVLVPAPSFEEYRREVRLQGATPVFHSAQDLLDADPADFALAFVCNPNNPTGHAYERARLEAFVDRARRAETPVLVDEAFLGFTDRESMAGTEGVLVARSLTKLFGLPGIRVGFAAAPEGYSERLRTAKRPWNLGAPALHVGEAVLSRDAFVRRTRRRVRVEREKMGRALSRQYRVYPSSAPFLLLEVTHGSVDDLLTHFLENGIVVRDARSFRGLDSHVRIAIREPDDNRRLEEVALDA
ncbi:MAG: aminotransferase class I/II-fold pyridoxal phosphate-dependent enzyme [Halanaeroarchaeum sp.]